MTDLNDVKAGEYELVAQQWRQVTSKPGEPYDYVQHRRGAIVTLDVADARRLVKAGAVKPVKAPKASGGRSAGDGGGQENPGGGQENPGANPGGGQGGSDEKPTGVKEILAEVGEDAEKAQAFLKAEQATDSPRSTLVKALEAIIAKAAGA
ncbi:hypothetical protein ABFU82_22545 [Nocardioides sp. WV_118_6]